MKRNVLYLSLILTVLLTGLGIHAEGQTARTLYFMDNAPARLKLNPALQPMRGYFNIPVIGGLGVSVVSNPLCVDDVMDILDSKNDFLYNDKLMGKLKTDNIINLDLNTDILSLGFYSGKGFWTVNLGTKVIFSTSIPKSLFEFARFANQLNDNWQDWLNSPEKLEELKHKNFNVKDLKVNADVFSEVGVGYSRLIGKNLTLGARVKLLAGIGNLDAHIKSLAVRSKIDLNTAQPEKSTASWNIKGDGKVDVSMKGLEFTRTDVDADDPQKGKYISDVDFDSPGLGGFGAGVDLGISYKMFNHLILSAAVTDLGFVSWSKSSTTTATLAADYDYKVDAEGANVFDYDMLQLRENEVSESRTTSLRPTLNVGAELSVWRGKLGLGVLSTTRFQEPEAFSELTLSANIHPKNWFAATLSYSFLHSDFETFGLGLKFGPVYLSTDYMVTGGFEKIERANAFVGISLPLGKKREDAINRK